MILNKVNYPEDLKKLSLDEKDILAKEIRDKIINTVANTGGHLASNLGIVELTIAIHSIFNTPMDKVIWDVGHQTYVHKMLTGRKNKLDSLRKYNGLAGFPKVEESIYDSFNTGHSSTSISVALGMARARDIKKENHKVIAVIGDGALTGGMALEALNDAGSSGTNLIVILNDNAMSISKNVGGISLMLSKLRTRNLYIKSNMKGKKIVSKIPLIGPKVVRFVQKTKLGIKHFFIPKMYFEDIGFRYLGPVDGHNIQELEKVLRISNNLTGPVLVHALTKKGKGFKAAEENPDQFHSAPKYDPKTGERLGVKKQDYSGRFGEKLVKLAKDNNRIVAITAAMTDGTGLKEFAKKYPDRFFDVGIAEQHAIGLASGLAKSGMVPFVPIYSSFLQRAYDQLIHDVAITSLPVVVCVDRAGIVGNDGETHQGLLDMSFGSTIPNFIVMAPKDYRELDKMMEFAMDIKKPVMIRYPRGCEEKDFRTAAKIALGKTELIRDGSEVAIVAIGKMVYRGDEVCNKLSEDLGIEAKLINARFVKPLDEFDLLEKVKNTKLVVTIEDGTVINGLGDQVERIFFKNKVDKELIKFAYPDKFIKHGSVSEIEKRYGMDTDNITNIIESVIEANNNSKIRGING